MVAELVFTLWLVAQAVPETDGANLLVFFSGFGIAGVLAALYIIDGRKRERENTETVRTTLSQILPLFTELRDVMRADTDAHHASAAAATATKDALDRYSHLLPTADQLARITVYLERLDRQ